VPPSSDALPDRTGANGLDRLLLRVDPRWVMVAFVAVAFAVYLLSNPARQDFYNHFVWQAEAWLDGRVAIPYPVETGPVQNGYFQDVLPLEDRPGYALIPFPPLPAIVLLPFVALFGLATEASLVAVAVGALNVGLCWRMLTLVTRRRDAAFLGTVFYGFGTVAWYAAMLGSTWFLAHVVASTFLFLAITAALDGERREGRGERLERLGPVVVRQAWAGLLFGVAALARLTTGFAAPFFLFVGPGAGWFRRGLSAAIGAVLPVLLLIGYNVATTGHVFHPAYEHLYRNEYRPVPSLWNDAWAIEDPRYIPQNAIIMLLWPPERPIAEDPACHGVPNRAGADLLFDPECPLLRPDKLGMSLFLTSPAYLLAIPVVLAAWRRRLVAGAALAVLSVALINLMHFSQGWVQFGYRFSNDFAPFATILVALGLARAIRGGPMSVVAVGLVVASVLVNAWGVYWGVTLGW
jgi:hypothetical protein